MYNQYQCLDLAPTLHCDPHLDICNTHTFEKLGKMAQTEAIAPPAGGGPWNHSPNTIIQ